MKKRLTSPAFYVGLVCIVLMAFLMQLHVTPYWTIESTYIDYINGSEENNYVMSEINESSIQSLIWFPRPDHEVEMKEFQTALRAETGDKKLDIDIAMKEYITMPIAIFFAAAVGIILCLIFGHSWIASLCPIFCGLGGMLTYSSNKMLLMFENKAADHKQFCMYILIAGAIHLVLALIPVVIKMAKKMKAKKAAVVAE